MIYRHLVTKSFDWGLISKSIFLNDLPYTKLVDKYGKVGREDYAKEVVKSFPDKVCINTDLSPIINLIKDSKVLTDLLIVDSDINSLDSVFSNKDALSILTSDKVDTQLRKTAVEMFSGVNPLTKERDVLKHSKFTSSIPIVVLTGAFPPQLDEENNSYFNPDGCVTVAEFLDSLNAIKFGSNSNRTRKKSLDNVSDSKDFFNEGYQSCLDCYSNPFYNLYTRKELLQPITRIELAYITVICWSEFRKKFGLINEGDYSGISFDWYNTKEILSDFDDGLDYKVSYASVSDYDEVHSIYLGDYLKEGSISELKERIKIGVSCIPYPMFMSLLELYSLGVFYFEDLRLDPLKEVSRGELSYFLIRIANILNVEVHEWLSAKH